jgi:ATP-binding cassette subfamily B protein RaxB
MRTIRQAEATECALACLAMIADHHGHRCDIAQLRQRFPQSLKGTGLAEMLRMAAALGMSSRPVKVELEDVKCLKLPCIIHWNERHFVVLRAVTRRHLQIIDPAAGPQRLSQAEFSKSFTGVAVELAPNESFRAVDERVAIDYRALIGNLFGFKRSVGQILALALCLEIFGLGMPLMGKWMIDDVLPSHDVGLYWIILLGFGLLLLMRVVTQYGRSTAVIALAAQFGLQWGTSLLARLLNVPLGYFEKRQLADVTSRFSSFGAIQRTVSTSFIEGILDGLMCLVGLLIMFSLSGLLSVVVVASSALYFVVRTVHFRTMKELQERQVAAAARQQSQLLESIRGILAIRLFDKVEQRRAQWQNLYVNEVNASTRIQYAQTNFATTLSLLQGTKDLLVMAVGMKLIMDNQFTIGAFMAFGAYGGTFSGRANSLVDRILEFRLLRVHAERLADFALLPPEIDPMQPVNNGIIDTPPTIEFKNVSYRYAEGEQDVLSHLSFTVHPGESVAIVGPSGVGKSTVLKLLLGICKPVEGVILINGRPLDAFGVGEFRKIVGTVLQDDALFTGSIEDNVAFFDNEPDPSFVRECARKAAIHDDIENMPMRYHTLIGDMGSALSGGQKQRVLLARALYKRPQVFLLDEATSHLDLANELVVNQSIRDLQATRIFVAHRPDTIRFADRVIDLRRHGQGVEAAGQAHRRIQSSGMEAGLGAHT